MKLNKENYNLFKTVLLATVRPNLDIPDELETDVMYEIVRNKEAMRGLEELKFIIKKDEQEFLFLDYYFKTDFSNTHYRFDHTGKLIELENFEGQYGSPVYESEEETKKERERIIRHNEKVRAILKAKGFER